MHRRLPLPPPVQTSGRLELRSGRWDWSVIAGRSGHLVVFRHARRFYDQMVGWLESGACDADEIRCAGVDPVHRRWEDSDGLVWRVKLGIPKMSGTETSDTVSVIFERGAVVRLAHLSTPLNLGEVTPAELEALLREASRRYSA